MEAEMKSLLSVVTVICIVILLLIGTYMWGMPKYRVYSLTKLREAQLKQAEWNRQITIKEAEAERESSLLKKETDITRAEGIAEANRIISVSLTEEYIKWKWVEGLHDGSSEVIYVPTEANLPILEARG